MAFQSVTLTATPAKTYFLISLVGFPCAQRLCLPSQSPHSGTNDCITKMRCYDSLLKLIPASLVLK